MIITGKYPKLRMRRSRKYNWSRRLVRENGLSGNDFILPIFLVDGKNQIQNKNFNIRAEAIELFKKESILLSKVDSGEDKDLFKKQYSLMLQHH